MAHPSKRSKKRQRARTHTRARSGTDPEEFRFRTHDNIGTYDADDDLETLRECFVDTGNLDVLRNVSDSRRIIVGRTGSGKTALLNMLAEKEDHCIRIRPDDLALSHITNSNTIRFFAELGVNLDPFYKLLWRHVLAVELLRYHFDIHDRESQDNFFARFLSLIKAGRSEVQARKRAADYLREWGQRFWEDSEYRVREITCKLENSLTAETGIGISPISAGATGASTFSEEQRAEVVHRAQRVVDAVQVKELNTILDVLNDVLSDRQKCHFVLIDRLDEDWVEDELRHKLIMALVQATRDFRRVKRAKVVIALRRDLLERVFRLARTSGFQKEKYESMLLPLQWSRTTLTTVLDRRVDRMVSARYHSRNATHTDVLPAAVDQQPPNIYFFELVRNPRDTIRLFNACIAQATGSPRIKVAAFRQAVGEYSRSRFHALADEWSADLPALAEAVSFLRKRPSSFKLSSIEQTAIEDATLELAIRCPSSLDPLAQMAKQVADGHLGWSQFRDTAILNFYKVGLVGLKLATHEKPSWIDIDGRTVSAAELDQNTSVVIHPAFHRALGIRP